MAKENEALLVRKIYDRYAYCRDNGHLHFIHKANKCDDYFAGLQWDPIIEKRLRRQGKPVLTVNKILATMAAVMGEQLKNRADISFKPLKGGSQEVANDLNKVYINIANNNKLDWVESNVADDGFITSRGFYDVRINFDDQMRGEVRIKHLNPRNVLIDPDAEEYDPDTWKDVIITKWLTLDDIELLYGKAKARRVRENGASVPFQYDTIERTHQTFGGFIVPPADSALETNAERKYRVIERQWKRKRFAWHFVDTVTGDLRRVPDNWTTAKIKKVAQKTGIEVIRKQVEQIRWTVVAYNTVLFDEWSPYEHFTVVPYFPFFRNGRTIGLVENLLSSQELLNKTASQELHIINTTANSGWKVKSGSLQNMTAEELEERGAETGLVMELSDVNDAEKIAPNTVPTGLDRVTFKADEYIKEISGVSDSLRGFDRADVAAKAIQAKQAAGSINLAKPLDNLARTRHLLATRVLNLIQTYYTEERVIQITGNTLGAEPETLVINERGEDGQIVNDLTVGEYDVVVTTAPAKNNFQESQFQEAVQLRELGVNIPDAVLIQNSSLANKEEIVQQQQGTPEQRQLEQQQAMLEMQAKQVEIAEKQTKAMLNRANAILAMRRAEQVAVDTGVNAAEATMKASGVNPDNPQQAALPGPQQGPDPQLMQLSLKRQDMDRKYQLEREKFDFEKQLKLAERADKIQQQLDQMALQEENRAQQ